MAIKAIPRALRKQPDHFFLFGPRGVGKSTWLKEAYPSAKHLSLLNQDLFLELAQNPSSLRKMLKGVKGWVCLDEIQKLPTLLDEVHLLMEGSKIRFALTGSSARKLRRGGADLLAGRAISLKMGPFTSYELGKGFNIERALEWGGLPLVWAKPKRAKETLKAYVTTYLKEEILEERIIRKVEPFSRFLQVAGILNGQVINFENIGREAKVPQATVKHYFEILEDTLIANKLMPYLPGLRVREMESPKLYWFDPGVARAAAGLLGSSLDPFLVGFALENWIFHEMKTYAETFSKDPGFYYYRTHHQDEIDFVIETRPKTINRPPEVVLVEVKNSSYLDSRWLQFFSKFSETKKIVVKSSYLVYRGPKSFTTDRGVNVLNVQDFLKSLWAGKIF